MAGVDTYIYARGLLVMAVFLVSAFAGHVKAKKREEGKK